MHEGTIETITLGNGAKRRIYLTGLGGTAPRRALVVLHEALGLNDDILRIADRFGREGFVVAAPDLFAGRGPKPFCIVKAFAALGKGGGDVLDDIECVRDYLASRGDVRGNAVGVVGFCMGGGFAVLAAGTGRFQVAAPFYGAVPKNPAKLPRLCPTIASYGGADEALRGAPEILEGHLARAGVPHEVKVYPGVGHSFMSHHPTLMHAVASRLPIHADYDAEAAEDSWARMRSFFDEQLGR